MTTIAFLVVALLAFLFAFRESPKREGDYKANAHLKKP
jgi:cbb3-type cytochrome oxidase subunit 3